MGLMERMKRVISSRPVAGRDSYPGLQRAVNEDRLATPEGVNSELLARRGHLFVVADGMGGHVAGEQASALAVSTVMDAFYRDASEDRGQALVEAIRQANAAIYRQAQHPETAGMGSTVVAALILGRDLTIAHVGDSRAYRVRGDYIGCLTSDHTWVAEAVRMGTITSDEARSHPNRHVLSRVLGSEPEVDVDLSHHRLRSGDRIVLASDGLSGVVSDEEICDIVTGRSPEAGARLLGELAIRRGSPDDVTVVVIDPFGSPARRIADRVGGWLRPFSTSMTPGTSLRAILAGTLLALLILAGVLRYAGWPGGRLPPGPAGEVTSLPTIAAVASPGLQEAYPPASPWAPLPPGSPAPRLPNRADVTGDGVVDIRDLIRIGRVYGQPAAVDPASDVNGDGQINLSDLRIVNNEMEK